MLGTMRILLWRVSHQNCRSTSRELQKAFSSVDSITTGTEEKYHEEARGEARKSWKLRSSPYLDNNWQCRFCMRLEDFSANFSLFIIASRGISRDNIFNPDVSTYDFEAMFT